MNKFVSYYHLDGFFAGPFPVPQTLPLLVHILGTDDETCPFVIRNVSKYIFI